MIGGTAYVEAVDDQARDKRDWTIDSPPSFGGGGGRIDFQKQGAYQPYIRFYFRARLQAYPSEMRSLLGPPDIFSRSRVVDKLKGSLVASRFTLRPIIIKLRRKSFPSCFHPSMQLRKRERERGGGRSYKCQLYAIFDRILGNGSRGWCLNRVRIEIEFTDLIFSIVILYHATNSRKDRQE